MSVSKFYKLINSFNELTDIPVVLNTSFNIQGQPIVETPLDALSTFSGNGIDCLFLENGKCSKTSKRPLSVERRQKTLERQKNNGKFFKTKNLVQIDCFLHFRGNYWASIQRKKRLLIKCI